jgi:hypothetical protein
VPEISVGRIEEAVTDRFGSLELLDSRFLITPSAGGSSNVRTDSSRFHGLVVARTVWPSASARTL